MRSGASGLSRWPISALGQSRRFPPVADISGLPSKADSRFGAAVPAASPRWPRRIFLFAVGRVVRHPSRSSIGAVLGPHIEGNGGTWSTPVDRIDNRFEYLKALRRQADTRADHNTGIVSGSQVTLHRLPSGFIRADEAQIALHPLSVICFSVSAIPAFIFSALISGGKAGLE
jgi:hypothetical protein